jgi:hypothetical protein
LEGLLAQQLQTQKTTIPLHLFVLLTFKRCVFDLENWIGGDAVVGGVSYELVEEVIGCIFDCDLSESDAIQYAYNTLNNIDSEEK